MRDKLMEAMEAKNNDIKSFVWKLARKADGTQEEIHLVDATPEQLNQFYKHCLSMLFLSYKKNAITNVIALFMEEFINFFNIFFFFNNIANTMICLFNCY